MTDLQTTNRGMKISKTFVHTIIARIYPLISNYNLLLLVALAGIASLGVTGALGGALVY